MGYNVLQWAAWNFYSWFFSSKPLKSKWNVSVMKSACVLWLTLSSQAWADGEHGAGWGSVSLGVQGGRSPQGGSCYPSSCRRECSPCSLHHHRPCGEFKVVTCVNTSHTKYMCPGLNKVLHIFRHIINEFKTLPCRSTASSSRCCLRAAGFPSTEMISSWSLWGLIPSSELISRKMVCCCG